MKPTPQSTAILIIVASAVLQISAWGEIIASGTLTDKSGDSEGEDLVSATVTVDDKSMVTFEVHFKKGSFKPGLSIATFSLDLDKNPATGASSRQDKLLGLEASISIPSYKNDFARTTRFKSDKDFVYGQEYEFATLDDGYRAIVPLKELGGSEATMNFKVSSQQAITERSATTIFDYMSDTKAPVGTVALIPMVSKNRMWTDAETGRTLEGILQSKSPDGGEVKIKRKDNGDVVTLKPERLAEADREFIKTWKPE